MGRKKGKKLTDKRRAKTPKRPQPKKTQAQLRKVSASRLKQILAAHKKWLETRDGKPPADLENKDAQGLNLSEADLRDAQLQKAILNGANLQEANLSRANLQEARLSFANLQEANLSGANLQEANLFGANLQGAYLFEVKAVTASQIKRANNWRLAFYSDDFLAELDLPTDHNETILKKFKEIEKSEDRHQTVTS
ncbi:MAG: pentapeptide repeat-containing protein [Acidiferrobacterales bacterium]